MGDKLLNAKFDKDINLMIPSNMDHLKIFKLLVVRLIDVGK